MANMQRILTLPVAGLRQWLDGSWAVLFSHPEDFACYGFEFDRWLQEVRSAFAGERVRPLALSSAVQDGCSWVCEVGGVLVGRPAGWLLDGLARVICGDPRTCQAKDSREARRIVVLDELLWPRRILRYEAGGRVPSPIDLAAATGSLRRTAR